MTLRFGCGVLVTSLMLACGSSGSSDGAGGAAGAAGASGGASGSGGAGGAGGATSQVDPAASGEHAVGATQYTLDHVATDGSPRPLDVVVWYPSTDDSGTPDEGLGGVVDAEIATGPFPLVIFSHGLGGVPQQSTFFTTHLASHGFVVAAMSHPGSTIADPFTDENLVIATVNRPGDVLATVDDLLERSAGSGDRFSGAIDPDRLGISGHSFGAFTTLAVLGLDSHPFSAGVPMAPPPADLFNADYSGIGEPTLIMAAVFDELAPYDGAVDIYDSLPEDQRWLLTFPNAGHFAYSDPCLGELCDQYDQDQAHRMVNTYGAAFLMKFIAGRTDVDGYLEPDSNIEAGEGRMENGAR